jgi:hypothetical protein
MIMCSVVNQINTNSLLLLLLCHGPHCITEMCYLDRYHHTGLFRHSEGTKLIWHTFTSLVYVADINWIYNLVGELPLGLMVKMYVSPVRNQG